MVSTDNGDGQAGKYTLSATTVADDFRAGIRETIAQLNELVAEVEGAAL